MTTNLGLFLTTEVTEKFRVDLLGCEVPFNLLMPINRELRFEQLHHGLMQRSQCHRLHTARLSVMTVIIYQSFEEERFIN